MPNTTTTVTAPLHARRCAVSTCQNWTNHESGVCPRCREKGLAAALSTTTPPHRPAQPIPELDLLESDVQIACLEVLDMLGWNWWRIGQRDARGTQDPGVSDILATKAGVGIVYMEVKRSRGGRQSEAQQRFQAAVEAAGGTYILVTDSHALFATLVNLNGGKND